MANPAADPYESLHTQIGSMLQPQDKPHIFWPTNVPNNPNPQVPGLPGDRLFDYFIKNMLVPGGGM